MITPRLSDTRKFQKDERDPLIQLCKQSVISLFRCVGLVNYFSHFVKSIIYLIIYLFLNKRKSLSALWTTRRDWTAPSPLTAYLRYSSLYLYFTYDTWNLSKFERETGQQNTPSLPCCSLQRRTVWFTHMKPFQFGRTEALHLRTGQSRQPFLTRASFSKIFLDPKFRIAFSVKLIFCSVLKGIKTEITAMLRASRRLRFEHKKRIMSSETRPESFGPSEKRTWQSCVVFHRHQNCFPHYLRCK